MSYTKTQDENITPSEEQGTTQHHSDGSELVPAEVQSNMRGNEPPSLDESSPSGYTINDEGLINNYAIEPEVSTAEYPSPQQQRRYVYWGVAAILLVSVLILTSFFVS